MTVWKELLRAQEHRPYPPPDGPFAMTMSWHDLLFAHWRVPADELRARVPAGLELDLWDNEAWIGVVPFRMTEVGAPSINQLPWVSAFPELNVRTYVRHRGKLGVYFFSLDAACWPAVVAARAGFRLPYFWARMACLAQGAGIAYRSRRLLGSPARFEAQYAPSGDVFESMPGTIEHWLTERYCLYTTDRAGRIYRGDIHHRPWPLQRAELDLVKNEMVRGTGLSVRNEAPLLHFVRRLDVVGWSILAV